MTPESIYTLIGIALGVAALIGGVFKVWPRVSHFFRRLNGTLDAIAGREAYIDPASGKEVERLMPLTQRMANVEMAVVQIASDHRVLSDHEKRISALEDARVERVVAKAESAQMWRAVAEHHEDVEQ